MGDILDFDAAELRSVFNTAPHRFSHRLAEAEDMFSLDLLGEAAEFLFRDNGKANVYCMRSASKVGQNFNRNIADAVDLAATVRDIESNGSWIVLKSLGDFPPFTDLVNAVEADFAAEIPEFRAGVAHQVRGYAFISSPGTLTPYHIDGEWSLLAQVKGRKHYRIFDVTDPRVMPNEEVEAFYHGDFDAATHASFKDETAQTFELNPGDALSQPRHAPHTVRVDEAEGYSITFGMSLLTNQWANEKPVHYANRMLRRAGLTPRPLGEAPMADAAKGVAFRAASKLGSVLPQKQAELHREKRVGSTG